MSSTCFCCRESEVYFRLNEKTYVQSLQPMNFADGLVVKIGSFVGKTSGLFGVSSARRKNQTSVAEVEMSLWLNWLEAFP